MDQTPTATQTPAIVHPVIVVKEIFTRKEAMAYFGNWHREAWGKLEREHAIPHFYLGGKKLFRKADLDALAARLIEKASKAA